MSIILFDNSERKKLYPLSNSRALADLRVGICTAKERWSLLSNEDIYIHTQDYLSVLYKPYPDDTHLWIDATILPDADLADRILALDDNEAITDGLGFVAGRKHFHHDDFSPGKLLEAFETIHERDAVKRLEHPWQIFQLNDEMLRRDFVLLTKNRISQPLTNSSQYINPSNIFIEEGANIQYSIINASEGPVYIGKNAVIMEGCLIRGPFALCNDAVLKMGTKIYGATTLGPCCVGGGEIKNSVMQGFSNKAHDGYIGDAVMGYWCNLGAGTSNSNVKNTAGVIKVWSAFAGDYLPTEMKCGFIMGDYTRTSINSSINTGSVIGTCCNVFGDGLLPKYIPDFEWGTKGLTRYELEKSLKDIDNWKKMKNRSLSPEEKKVLEYIFETF